MKLFIFFSLVLVFMPFTYSQEQKREELQASQQDILKTSVELAEVRSDEVVIRQEIIRRGLSKPDSINNIITFRQAQCDFNLLVTL